jgi:transcription elongation factor GreA
VSIGSRVTVVEEEEEPETYHIVGSTEADPRSGRISNESPLGRALMGHQVGDEVIVDAPDGILCFRVVAIE